MAQCTHVGSDQRLVTPACGPLQFHHYHARSWSSLRSSEDHGLIGEANVCRSKIYLRHRTLAQHRCSMQGQTMTLACLRCRKETDSTNVAICELDHICKVYAQISMHEADSSAPRASLNLKHAHSPRLICQSCILLCAGLTYGGSTVFWPSYG